MYMFSKLFGTVFWGILTATIQVRRQLVCNANFKYLNLVWVVAFSVFEVCVLFVTTVLLIFYIL